MLPAEQEKRVRQTLQEMTFAFPTVRQGAGEVSFPVDIFCCFHPGSARATYPVLSVLAGFQPLTHHILAACQCLVE